MKRTLPILAAVMGVIGLLIVVAWFVPLPLNPYLDFQVLYRADQGILQGIPLYDRAGQAQMVAESLGVTVEQVFVLPFPYPPWYAVLTLPLALFPIEVAVRMWFLLNLIMLMISVWLITDGWEPRKRLYSFFVAPLFFPIFGALLVGQYVFPTILGMALLAYALRYKNTVPTALGMAFITFKPHVGIFLLLAVLIHLLVRRDEFGRRAFLVIAVMGVMLFTIGFVADPAWPVNYGRSLFEFKDVSECKLCISLPVMITEIAGGGFDQAVWVSLFLCAGLAALLIPIFHRLPHENLVAAFTCMALLVNPYLQNYDFAFAVIPLLIVSRDTILLRKWLVPGTVFLLPWFGLGLFGRMGSPTLLLSTIILTLVVLTGAYNKNTILS